ncbi:hypothetical protein RM555_22590 [Micromonospora sp. DSM 115977]|uniref:Uncharacterized protein n=1 Tax=Micromonospora reichwaldensis TaxID=3075516 RepID=A0ABU2X0T1_9ACTN|nr:hypothetical protein [Micromonospora sp. DSM 115977]MDT0531783.1 hypothetical protein [Micromonospora sp. DSM 115977]
MTGVSEPVARDGGVLDGFHIRQVPGDIGAEVSDFASEWDDVRFATRVWERQTDDGYQVDLRVHVMRGERLTDLAALRDFLTEYHERDPADWPLTEFTHGATTGLHDDSQAFWSAAPGVAVNVLVDPGQVDRGQLLATALAVVAVSDRDGPVSPGVERPAAARPPAD